jgi:hypothetical protein
MHHHIQVTDLRLHLHLRLKSFFLRSKLQQDRQHMFDFPSLPLYTPLGTSPIGPSLLTTKLLTSKSPVVY